jgi:hypothetical protein
MNANLRLQIANRIHLMLARELGEGIEVSHLLRRPLYARDVLFVCDALEDTPLPDLARQFRELTRDEAPAPEPVAPEPFRMPLSAVAPHGTLSRRRSSPPSAT